MKKQQRFLLLVTSAMLLASCGPSAATSANSLTSDSKSEAENSASSSAVSASSTTSSVSGDSVTFSAALTLLTNMAEQETALSNKVHEAIGRASGGIASDRDEVIAFGRYRNETGIASEITRNLNRQIRNVIDIGIEEGTQNTSPLIGSSRQMHFIELALNIMVAENSAV